MMSCSYLPSYAFKKYCSGSRALNNRNEYPFEVKNLYFEVKKHEAIFDELLDLKTLKGKGYKKLSKT